MTLAQMLTRVKRRLSITDCDKDELLEELLADANALMLAYMRREDMPAALETAQCLLAAALYNRLGMEGESARTEGGVSLTVDTLPREITAQMDAYRLVKAVML